MSSTSTPHGGTEKKDSNVNNRNKYKRPPHKYKKYGINPVQNENVSQQSFGGQASSDNTRNKRRTYKNGSGGINQAQDKKNLQPTSEPELVFDYFLQKYVPRESEHDRQLDKLRPFSPTVSIDSQESSRSQRESNYGGHYRGNKTTTKTYKNNSSDSNKADKREFFEYFSFNQLSALSEMESDEIAFKLFVTRNKFKEFLNSSRIQSPDFVVKTLCVLSKLVHANFSNLVINLLHDIYSSTFFESIQDYLRHLPQENKDSERTNRFYWQDINGFWYNLMNLFKRILILIPTCMEDRLIGVMDIAVLSMEAIEIQGYYAVDEKLKFDFSKLAGEIREEYRKNLTLSTNTKASTVGHFKNFRTLSVVPTEADLRDNLPFLRPNKTDGAYDSVEHYLDVQYRLLREDFICPLRNGIQEYQTRCGTNKRSIEISDIKVYENVKLICPAVINNGLGISVSFGILNLNWDYSDRFMFGSLLCLSNDQFETVLFATVAHRDKKLLQNGELIIQPCVGTTIDAHMYHSEFVMIESKTYFFPYYHTLNGLRHMFEDNFPMKRYIVDGKSTINPPKYLKANPIYYYQGFQVMPMADYWPSAKQLGFNEYQFKAFKSALVQEVSVIHGPPGTGKTYMALQIARILLDNSENWYNSEPRTPMVVVCLTNHALDQFLESILSFTKSIVRIGEQSKHPSLENYKLKSLREEHTKCKDKSKPWRHMNYLKHQCKQKLEAIESAYSALRALTDNRAIVSTTLLRRYCDDDEIELKAMSDNELRVKLVGVDLISAKHISENTQAVSEADADMDSENEDSRADDEIEMDSVKRVKGSNHYCLTLSDLETEIASTNMGRRQFLQSIKSALEAKLSCHPLVTNASNSFSPKHESWEIYWHWVTSSHENVKNSLSTLEREYENFTTELNEVTKICDLELMRGCKVVGLTTAGAARLHESLRALKSPIVIVEEAAEILEAHVVCSLTQHCQHLILIGDHKQLRPKPATYKLELHYNLNVSLFERLINMRDNYTQLTVQHRMRPEIAKLLCPTMYENLENHSSVFSYPPVKGMHKNMFFLNHQYRERSYNSAGYCNLHEVQFFIALTKYLRQQGYEPNEITILCMYNGQMCKFREEKKKQPSLLGVHITTVDNYQGEENKIILLSLVRNNGTGNIGFLRKENRVCVALSRAREGFYIMGNMNDLLVNNTIWPKIKMALDENKSIGTSLVLRCSVHTDQTTEVKCAKDFEKAPLGGCLRQCGSPLRCGHHCKKVCHISDRAHESYVCSEPCSKTCPRGHPCPLQCGKRCEPCVQSAAFQLKCTHKMLLPCGTNINDYKCTAPVQAVLHCGHFIEKPCHQSCLETLCSHICNKTLSCGHTCQQKCHINDDPHHTTAQYHCKEKCGRIPPGCTLSHPCNKTCGEPCGECSINVKKARSCGHKYSIKCSEDVEKTVCMKPCKRQLPCGHTCSLKCEQECIAPCEKCNKTVKKISPEVESEVKCGKANVGHANSSCQRSLECGHRCTSKSSEPCTKRCEHLITLPPESTLCQHSFRVPCYKIEAGLANYADKLLEHCDTPCLVQLPCGHTCRGTCGSCKQGRIHKPCFEECKKILICGHKCEASCNYTCPPCKKICSLKCHHTDCLKKCTETCEPCMQPCGYGCEHSACKKLCSEMCDREPCKEPCPKKLACGHNCIGFCGDKPCPPLCRVCNQDQLVCGDDKPQGDARYVYLRDCNHCVLSDYLDWQWQKSDTIGLKVCPICGTRISFCERYSNPMKEEQKFIKMLKLQTGRKFREFKNRKPMILSEINSVEERFAQCLPGFEHHKNLFQSFLARLDAKILNSAVFHDIHIKLSICGIILDNLAQLPIDKRYVDNWPVVKNEAIIILTSLRTSQYISEHTEEEVQNELVRLHYMIQLCRLEAEDRFRQNTNVLEKEIIYLGLLNLRKFTESSSNAIYKQMSQLTKSMGLPLVIKKHGDFKFKKTGLIYGDWKKCANGHIYMGKCYQCPKAPFSR